MTEYKITLTEIEIKKIIGLIEVVIQPLRKAAKKQIIPKHKREAEQTLSEVEIIINKFKKEISNDD